ncbi:MAG: DUF4363 family protein [Oscillospiraceae bacterium]|nr:DUF4363 family protein [Oscillospiraceae bacterium]
MKRFVIALVLMAAIMIYSVVAFVCLAGWQGDVSEIIDEIKLYNETGDNGKTSAAADELTKEWVTLEKKMSIFVSDEKLNSISTSVAKVPQFVKEANDELDAELESIRRQLKLLCRGELPLWYNLL